MVASFISFFARLLTGATPRWRGCEPVARQRVYFANHTSNLDFVLLWAALPAVLRQHARPVAAHDYWNSNGLRRWLAGSVFRAVLIERKNVTRENNPLAPMLAALSAGDSLIIFPEGGRMASGEMGPFKSGIYHLAREATTVELVPVYIENLNRVLPKGEVLPVPILCSVHFGAPLRLEPGESKARFLERAREAVLQLQNGMNLPHDPALLRLFGGVFLLLTVSSVTGSILRRTLKGDAAQKVVANLNARIFAWWIMVVIFGIATLIGRIGSVVLFSLTSFLALREFVTLTPTRLGDHRALFLAFFVVLPAHYWLLATQWYGLFVIFIPVYAFLFIPIRIAVAGDCECYLERTAKVQWALMVCVYFVSHAPALTLLKIPGYEGQGAKLLFFLVCVVQMSDVLQYVWGKLIGKTPIAPKLSPNKTVEGFVGGGLTATALGAGLWWITPFTPLQAAGFAALCVVMGFFGGLVMSAIKRDRGVKDYGEILPGHGGMMDRIDSICFAAPVFFHMVRYFFEP